MTNSNDFTPPDPSIAPVAASLYELLAPFTGYRYTFLLALLREPDKPVADVARSVGVTPEAVYNWRYVVPGFKEALAAIKEGHPSLRTEYARLAFLEATPRVADAMVDRAQGKGTAAQRAAERILETVGVLKQDNSQEQTPIQVTTHTYVLVQPQPSGPGAIVEATAKELPSGT